MRSIGNLNYVHCEEAVVRDQERVIMLMATSGSAILTAGRCSHGSSASQFELSGVLGALP